MPYTTRNTIVLCVLAAMAILASARPVYACSVSGEPPTLEETIASADIIVVGQVIGSDGFFSNGAALLVEKYLKGSGPDILFSEGYGFGGGDCRNAVFPWQGGIFYLDGDTGNGESLTASYAYPYYAVLSVNDDIVAEFVQITGQISSPVPATFDIRVRAFGMFFSWVLTAVVMFILPLIVALCFLIVIGKVMIFFVRLSVRRVKHLTSQRTAT